MAIQHTSRTGKTYHLHPNLFLIIGVFPISHENQLGLL